MRKRVRPASSFDLLRRSIDLRQWYRRAASACEPGLQVVLNDHATTLDLIVADLQALIRRGGGTPTGYGSWHGLVHRVLAGGLIDAGAHRDEHWIQLLAKHENALLQAMQESTAAASVETMPCLHRQLSRLHGIRLDMHSLAGTAGF